MIVPLPVTSPEPESAAEMLRPTVLESAAIESTPLAMATVAWLCKL